MAYGSTCEDDTTLLRHLLDERVVPKTKSEGTEIVDDVVTSRAEDDLGPIEGRARASAGASESHDGDKIARVFPVSKRKAPRRSALRLMVTTRKSAFIYPLH